MQIISKISRSLKQVHNFISSKGNESESRITPFAIFSLVAYLLYYFINSYFFSNEKYDNLSYRFLIALLSLVLLLRKNLPVNLKKFIPYLWYITLIIAMPFFVFYMTLQNDFASAWIMNFLSITILMMLLVDWLSYLFIFITGIALAFFAIGISNIESLTYNPGTLSIKDIINTFTISLVMGLIFSRNKAYDEKIKLELINAFSASIAHELRTPLAIISMAAKNLKNYFKKYLGIDLAQESEKSLHKRKIAQAYKISEDIIIETENSNKIITLFLENAKLGAIQKSDFDLLSIQKSLILAIERYPFQRKKQALVKLGTIQDFTYRGKEVLTLHILFNLLKNALYYIHAAGKGEVLIWTQSGAEFNHLFFKDTGQGISRDILPYIFDKFFSRTYHGTGVGLAFCKTVMAAYGGYIKCDSVEGEYALFELGFPVVKNLQNKDVV